MLSSAFSNKPVPLFNGLTFASLSSQSIGPHPPPVVLNPSPSESRHPIVSVLLHFVVPSTDPSFGVIVAFQISFTDVSFETIRSVLF